MTIRVKLYSRLRDVSGVGEIELDKVPETVNELLSELSKRFGEKFEKIIYEERKKNVRDRVMILVNGHSIRLLKGLGTPLREDDSISIDTIDVMEIVGGG